MPQDLVSAADYQRYAARHMTANARAYVDSAAADELSHAANLAAFARHQLQTSVLADVRGGHCRSELFGLQLSHPLLLAPVAYQKLVHADGERAAAYAACEVGSSMLVSTLASTPLEDIAAAASGPLWFQLYWQPQREVVLDLVRRAEAAGYRALVLTVDAPLAGVRNAEQRAGFQLPPGVFAANLAGYAQTPPAVAAGGSMVFDGLMAQAPGWQDLAWLRQQTRLPLLLKGVQGARDALRAIDCGVDGLIVSNHGGRVLDSVPASLDALPAVATTVAGRVPLLLDGGVRRGSDILKALALGASAVLIGRPYIHALATAGALGVAHLLRILQEELEVAMALTGCRTLADIDRQLLWTEAQA
ncbi:alpha-hydroxy acid oxidase [Vogesella sp. LIG4]|uniref:alpha-hydroxy acid oxidase n=1 Tax=Vogesella sp. LIG4 TaxID=1192162 RepID=UPI0018D3B34D|nr:alpha-hydroxy acid oxidase [Vogesella sp. LIG4]